MKNYKKFVALSLTAVMVIGSTMTVFASETGDEGTDPAPTAGVGEGEGTYEGGEMKYPTLSVTLPTIPEGTYDYIADPNGLIAATSGEKYANSTFIGTTGVFFLTSTADDGAKTYTADSTALSLTNENAQDIDVTVKLEQKAAGDSTIKYAESATFDAADKDNKLYLAITDGAASNPKTAALTGTGAATIKTTVAGIPGNYEAGYTEADGYQYTLKDEADLTDWNECSFNMTGALNKNAKWGDDLDFPAIKVTWSYAEHRDSALSAAAVSKTSNSVTVTGANVTGVKMIKANGGEVTLTTQYTFKDGTLSFNADMLGGNVGGKLQVTLSTGVTEELAIQ